VAASVDEVVAAASVQRVIAAAARQRVVQAVARDGVAQGPTDDVLDRVAGREGQGQPRVDHLRRRVAEVDAHGAGGGGRAVERVDPAAGLVDGVAAQAGLIGVEAVDLVCRLLLVKKNASSCSMTGFTGALSCSTC